MAEFRGTIRPAADFDAVEDATALRESMKGLGTDEEVIIELLCSRNNDQRQEIIAEYKSGYGRDLEEDLKGELGGEFEDVILALMLPPFKYLCSELNQAMSGGGTDEDVLFETLCTHSNDELEGIKATYEEMFETSLEDAVESEVSGNFKSLLTALLQARRDESYAVDTDLAADQAKALYEAGEDEAGTDEESFTVVIATQNRFQLQAIMSQYEEISEKSLIEAIESETGGSYRHALLATVKASLNRPAYFAERIRSTMKGAGTRDGDLIRMIVSRAEYDLDNIKEEYLSRYGETLVDDVSSETSGDYKKALVMLIEGN